MWKGSFRYISLLHPWAGRSIFLMKYLIALFLGVLLLQDISSANADFDDGLAAYERGDYAAALNEFRPLAEQGDANAQAMLGGMYGSGRGVPRNYLESVKWGKLAAEQGNAEAQFNLAMFHAFGLGDLAIDAVEAYKWAVIAATNGVEEAVNFQKYIEEAMSPREIEKARDLARECVKNNYKACFGEFRNEKFLRDGPAVGEQSEASDVSLLEKAKIDCEELGFTPKTESFGNCVLKLMD